MRTAQSSAVWLMKMRDFAAGVLLDVGMTVEVIGGEIQEHGDPRPEGLDRLELEAAGLDDVNGLSRVSTCALSALPMLPPTSTLWPPASSIRPVKRRGRGLAFRAGDRDDASAQPARRELQFADDRHAGLARGSSSGIAAGTPGLSTIRSAPVNVSVHARRARADTRGPQASPRQRCLPACRSASPRRRGGRAGALPRRRCAPHRRR